ncbi:hypothetical protein PACTADRAFT_42432 [Pachysolen tannophilus NRRL Y-2460]|uniref:Probable electron transfer flavoprotein subunit alpha n=1 Tax=Pachysolen tannophilus NRRL Y-2460 TaxID=669874 RepID=A0A1E4TUM4_PACTA|nr:hypothetical protein PACTADRAFT_42432 [Pachysolen tannophilus NRRL Y-2460]
MLDFGKKRLFSQFQRFSIVRNFKIKIRLNSTLAFVEAKEGAIAPSSLSSLTAATKIGKPITALLVGSNASEISKELLKISAISKILISKNSKFDHYLPEHVSPLIVDILQKNQDFTHLVVPGSTVGKNILPRIAALLDVQPVSDVMKIESENTFVRPIYAGNAWETLKNNEKLILLSVRGSAFPQIEINSSENNNISIEEITAPETISSVEFISEQLVQSERPDLGSAKSVVSGGRALKSKEQFEQIIEPLALALNAAIGASRAAVDSGFCDNSLQVGQTGKVVAPDLYIAIGISGAIQHLAGMKDSKVIVAINKDEEAPIFNLADVGIVGDVFQIVPELTEKIKNLKK